MQDITMKALESSKLSAISSDGFVLLNSFLKPVFINPVAAKILSYPREPRRISHDKFLARRIRSLFFSGERSSLPALVSNFQSGNRVYEGRAYRVNPLAKGNLQVSVAILLQRRPRGSTALNEVSEAFNLTTREQQVLQRLSHGLTTKEIALGMEISPNTVKSFVRMIMVKMGVSTRSGIVGKALGAGT